MADVDAGIDLVIGTIGALTEERRSSRSSREAGPPPPWARATVRRSPARGRCRRRGRLVRAAEALERPRRNSAGTRRRRSMTWISTVSVFRPRLEVDRPGAVAQGVVDHAPDRLIEPRRVGEAKSVRSPRLDPAPRPAARRANLRATPSKSSARFRRLRRSGSSPRSVWAIVEQVLGEPDQPIRLLGGRATAPLAAPRASELPQRQLELRPQDRQRGPQLVTGVGDERRSCSQAPPPAARASRSASCRGVRPRRASAAPEAPAGLSAEISAARGASPRPGEGRPPRPRRRPERRGSAPPGTDEELRSRATRRVPR